MFEYDFADHSSESGSETNPDNSGFSFLCVPCGFGRMACLHDEFSGLLEKRAARFGQFHAALVAHKEGDAEILFQLTDLTTQRRLRDVQLLSSLREVEVFRDGDEVSNVTQFHGPVFYTS
jgi:hypothetical protein